MTGIADEHLGDDGEGVGVPDRLLGAEDHPPAGLPAERALEPGRVRQRLGDDLRLLVFVGLEVGRLVPYLGT
jgi:hypothetical protein